MSLKTREHSGGMSNDRNSRTEMIVMDLMTLRRTGSDYYHGVGRCVHSTTRPLRSSLSVCTPPCVTCDSACECIGLSAIIWEMAMGICERHCRERVGVGVSGVGYSVVGRLYESLRLERWIRPAKGAEMVMVYAQARGRGPGGHGAGGRLGEAFILRGATATAIASNELPYTSDPTCQRPSVFCSAVAFANNKREDLWLRLGLNLPQRGRAAGAFVIASW